MQSSRFQLGLIAALAVGLGFSLSSSDAVGYPAGAAVSLGNNPVWSHGGQLSGGVASAVMTTGSDHGMGVTDVHASMLDGQDGCNGHMRLDVLVDGANKGSMALGVIQGSAGLTRYDASGSLNLSSGIYVEPDSTLQLVPTVMWSRNCDGPNMAYTLSGYLAQP